MIVGEDFREEISVYVDIFFFFKKIHIYHGSNCLYCSHAAKCKAFIPFINLPWCRSRECGYEFKIALRVNLVNQGSPLIFPLILDESKVFAEYLYSFLAYF